MPIRTGFFYVPNAWINYKIKGKKLPGKGYATFRLKIRLKVNSDKMELTVRVKQFISKNINLNGSGNFLKVRLFF